jgi:hypothetical protein
VPPSLPTLTRMDWPVQGAVSMLLLPIPKFRKIERPQQMRSKQGSGAIPMKGLPKTWVSRHAVQAPSLRLPRQIGGWAHNTHEHVITQIL